MYIPHFLLPLAASAGLVNKRATVCNGHAELCGRSYGAVTHFGSHDSFAFSDDPLVVSRDQIVDIPTQLGLGVRLLQAQAHMNGGDLHFCHTSCILFDGGKVTDYLKTVKTFLDKNPNEVVTFIFTNPEGASVKDVWKKSFDDAGITPLAYVPPSTPLKASAWPTLGQMIDSGKRVVVFLDSGADVNQVNFILPEFDHVWETPFSRTDNTFPCKVDRISGPLSVADHMYMINHSLNVDVFGTGVIVPDRIHASTTNGVASITAEANGCVPVAGGKKPNFVLLDWVNIGEGLKAVNQLNGVPDIEPSPSPSPSPSASPSPTPSSNGTQLTSGGVVSTVSLRMPQAVSLSFVFAINVASFVLMLV